MEKNNIKEFKCEKCGHRFYAQESAELVCPNCKSKDVSPVKSMHMGKTLLGVLIFVSCVGISYFVTGLVRSGSDIADNQSLVVQHEVDVVEEQSSPVPVVEEKIETQFDPVVGNNYVYAFNAHCNLDGEEELIYELLPENGDNVLVSNTDGKFAGIQPSPTGIYRVRVRVKRTGRMSEPQLVTGFVERPTIKIEPMSKEELEEKINARTAFRERVRISPMVKLNYVNLREEIGPKDVQEIGMRLKMKVWLSVKVKNVEYDSSNVVTAISLEIVYNDKK